MKAEEQYTSERYEAQVDSYNSIVFRLDPSAMLENVKARLLNQAWDQKTKEYVQIKGLSPKFDVVGIEELMIELYARMSVDKALSNLDRNEINNIIRQAGEVVLEFIYFKGEKYNIKESDWNDIKYIIQHNIRTFLNRALNGRENELLTKAFQQRETINKSGHTTDMQGQTPKPSIFRR